MKEEAAKKAKLEQQDNTSSAVDGKKLDNGDEEETKDDKDKSDK